jgi:signal transduction histidine kinase
MLRDLSREGARIMEQTRPTLNGWMKSWAPGGNGVTASISGFLAIAMGVLIACACAWTLYMGSVQGREARFAKVDGLSSVLGTGVSQLLTRGDEAGAQRLLVEAVSSGMVENAQVVLPGGRVALDAATGLDGATRTLPERWEGDGVDAAAGTTKVVEGDVLRLSHPVIVPGRGPVEIVVRADVSVPLLGDARTQLGLGAVVLVGTIGLLITALLVRDRLRGLVAVGRVLGAAGRFDQGELPTTGLRLNENLGDEAVWWNRVLEERDRLRARASLEDAGEKFRGFSGGNGEYAQAFDALWLGMLIVDDRGTVLACNGAAAVLLKRQKQEVTGAKLTAVVEDTPVVDAMASVLAGKTKQRTAVEVSRCTPGQDDKVVLRYTIRPLRREDGASAIVLLEDVTQQRVADESRNSFVAQATHELRTPLTTIRLYHEQLLELGEAGDALEKAKCLNVIGSEVRRLERIVGDMLSVSEIEAGTFKLMRDDVKLDEILRTLEGEFAAQAEDKEISLSFEHAAKLPMVAGDRDKVVMALHNLIGNALKYTPAGGSVIVRAAHEHATVSVDVIDNGIGIAESEHELVFQKFYRSKDKRVASISGSGIGLALAREVMRLHGGDVTIKSQIDKGSTFTLSLPAVEAQQSVQRAAA